MQARRLLDVPIIHPGTDPIVGDNINGPSLIQAPDWITKPLGRYYLYFAHHKGHSIRLAVADSLTGPWRLYRPGSLDLPASLFEVCDLAGPSDPASLSENGANRDYHYAHVASPDVHVDSAARTVRMYYHGLHADGTQMTRLAVSGDGLRFEALPPLLGPPYFRAFRYRKAVYALSYQGFVFRAPRWEGPFERGHNLFAQDGDADDIEIFRHGAVQVEGNRLVVCFTRIGDCPERILWSEVDLDRHWRRWCAGPPMELLRPERVWEGATLEPHRSVVGGVYQRVHALRDPCLFRDADGSNYLLYSGAGESGIGIAAIARCSQRTR